MGGKKILTLAAFTIAFATASVVVGPGPWTLAPLTRVEAATLPGKVRADTVDRRYRKIADLPLPQSWKDTWRLT